MSVNQVQLNMLVKLAQSCKKLKRKREFAVRSGNFGLVKRIEVELECSETALIDYMSMLVGGSKQELL